MKPLGTLTKVNLRTAWEREDTEFTPWLAQEDNLAILADTIGLDLELEAQERYVGPFRADILCKDTGTGNWVIIENQLEKTDHIHLGQIITYASGLEAKTIVWVSSNFTEEHRAALDWLNQSTIDDLQFFGLEVELWQIGDSLPAPKFNIVAKPNDWTRSVSQSASRIADSVTPIKALQLKYWEGLREFMAKVKSPLRCQTPSPQHWYVFGVGKSGFNLTATINTRDNRLGAEFYIYADNAKELFALLCAQKAGIESDFGGQLDWQELEGKKACRIAIYKESTAPTNEADWPNQFVWIKSNLECLDKAFRQRIKNLQPLNV